MTIREVAIDPNCNDDDSLIEFMFKYAMINPLWVLSLKSFRVALGPSVSLLLAFSWNPRVSVNSLFSTTIKSGDTCNRFSNQVLDALRMLFARMLSPF